MTSYTFDTFRKGYEARNKKTGKPERNGTHVHTGWSLITDGFTFMAEKTGAENTDNAPDIMDIIGRQRKQEFSITFGAKEMRMALKNAAVFVDKDVENRTYLVLESSTILVCADNEQTGRMSRELLSSSYVHTQYSQAGTVICFNHEYLKNIIKFCGDATITMKTCWNNVCFIYSQDGKRLGAIMPMTLDSASSEERAVIAGKRYNMFHVQQTETPDWQPCKQIVARRGSEKLGFDGLKNNPPMLLDKDGKYTVHQSTAEYIEKTVALFTRLVTPGLTQYADVVDASTPETTYEAEEEYIVTGKGGMQGKATRKVTRIEPAHAILDLTIYATDKPLPVRDENGKKQHIVTPQVAAYKPLITAIETVAQPAPILETPIAEISPLDAIYAKYAWIEKWESDTKKRFFKATIANGKINRRDEIAAISAPINVTADFQNLTIRAL